MGLRTEESNRLNLNDLLKRAEERKKAESKLNLAIVAGTLSIAAIVVFLLSF
tara:strand:+ start:257 stop:412 length:156 start_codon:yes stop_codon:yes gene_type:complete